MSAGAHPSEATRRVSILRSVRAAARRQADKDKGCPDCPTEPHRWRLARAQ